MQIVGMKREVRCESEKEMPQRDGSWAQRTECKSGGAQTFQFIEETVKEGCVIPTHCC